MAKSNPMRHQPLDPFAKWKCSDQCRCFKCQAIDRRPTREATSHPIQHATSQPDMLDAVPRTTEMTRVQKQQALIFSPKWFDSRTRDNSPLQSVAPAPVKTRHDSYLRDISPNASTRERLSADDKDEIDALKQMKSKIDTAISRARAASDLTEVDELDEDNPANYTASITSSLELTRSMTNGSTRSNSASQRSSTSSRILPQPGIKRASTMPPSMDDTIEVTGFSERFKANTERASSCNSPAWTPPMTPLTGPSHPSLTRPTSNVSLFSLPSLASALHPHPVSERHSVPERQRQSASTTDSGSVSRSSSRAMTLAEENAFQAARLASAHRECAHSSEQQVEQWKDQVLDLRNEVRQLRNEGREVVKLVGGMRDEIKGLLAEVELRAGEVRGLTGRVGELEGRDKASRLEDEESSAEESHERDAQEDSKQRGAPTDVAITAQSGTQDTDVVAKEKIAKPAAQTIVELKTYSTAQLVSDMEEVSAVICQSRTPTPSFNLHAALWLVFLSFIAILSVYCKKEASIH